MPGVHKALQLWRLSPPQLSLNVRRDLHYRMADLMTQPCIIHNEATSEYYFEERCHITELRNSPHDQEASIASARVAPGITTRLHRLEGVTERYVILEGKGRVEVGELGPEAVSSGNVVVIPPGTPQRITNIGSSDLIFLAICTPRFTLSVYEDIDADVKLSGPG